jgi:hypothetical protein
MKKLFIAFIFVLFLALPQGVEARTICRTRGAVVVNNIVAIANTGNNTVFGNTHTGNITTGNATLNVTVTNRVNISKTTITH